jgi:hypothetical protein
MSEAAVHGLRTWKVSGERLAGPLRGTVWPEGGEWLTATCEHGHAAPDPDCDCGLHALHPTVGAARRVLAVREEIAGVLEAGGRLEIGPDGFRAERGRPSALVATPGRNRAEIDRLAARYAVPVVEVRGPGELAAWCAERGLGLPADSIPRVSRRARRAAVRVAVALAIAALLVIGGLELLSDPSGPRTINGRNGEVQID